MTTLPFAITPDEGAAPAWGPPVAHPARRDAPPQMRARAALATALKAAWQRHRSRAALAQMNDFMLKDIGLTRIEAQNESSKPFWRI